jgi:phosphoserine phosphatase
VDLDLAGSFTPLTASSEETIAVTVVAATEAETTDDSETGRVLRKLVNDEALNDELDEEVDLHDLIKPLASIVTCNWPW